MVLVGAAIASWPFGKKEEKLREIRKRGNERKIVVIVRWFLLRGVHLKNKKMGLGKESGK